VAFESGSIVDVVTWHVQAFVADFTLRYQLCEIRQF
jgi:hypothetical protein